MLYENEFDAIWEKSLKGKIIEFSELFGIKHKSLFWLKIFLNYYYNRYKEKVVKTYMVWDTVNIDRHKIAACIMKAILVVKPLYIPLSVNVKFIFTKKQYCEILNHKIKNEKQSDDFLRKYFIFYNEYLAINIAKTILDSYINSNPKKGRFKHKIITPEPFPEPDHDYLRDFCIGLHYSDIKSFNPITYANLLFLWEKYSCRKTRCDNLAKEYVKLFQENAKLKNEEICICEDELSKAVENAMFIEQPQVYESD